MGSLLPIGVLVSRRKDMPRIKFGQNNSSRFLERKLSLEDIPQKTMKVTVFALRWVFLLIFLFITVGICILLLTGGTDNIQIILSYSIAGFFTFFMGYFGWVLAQGMIETITGENEKILKSMSYYIRKRRNHKRHRY
jgi:hypothetical protein